ncbi:stemmadenine O-acetyltransferase-like [Vigna umbellata]|uniref:stemmadenine O-acetyltransferase-like n=1 Tax=Vigna umbellata TaxID=87088 RepID=UPI001F5E3B54|nr:stemmadenine O-acetyltransferase-like [Vigna umbellata]XP_047175297.1 stemmadenine O-acetyltransferase-like [Vigna umbellata]
MSGEMKFEEEQRRYIKPSIATPPHLQTFKLSLLDQLFPNIHGNITFFYPHTTTHTLPHFSTKSQLLQTSLSQTLTRFYPLAGNLHDATTLHCNDAGALFIQSQTNVSLSDILKAPSFNTLQCLIPSTDNQTSTNAAMLLVRFTSFSCGGTAVTISLSHKIADIAAVIALLKTWTAACAGETPTRDPELAAGAALFPPRELPAVTASVNTVSSENFTSRRFVFEASKVKALKKRIGEGCAFEPSRVEVVLALIWKCALSASRPETASFKHSVLFQAVNLRPRMEPAVADGALGNFVWPFAVTVEEEEQLELQLMVKRMRESMKEFVESKAKRLKEDGGFGVFMESLKERGEVLKQNSVVYKCSSWCKFPLAEVDFGWGEAVWACSVNKIASNTIALMDTRDGGVEAFVTLDHQHMLLFQQHHLLLHYALLNPSVML